MFHGVEMLLERSELGRFVKAPFFPITFFLNQGGVAEDFREISE
jgi:hypothetical protein